MSEYIRREDAVSAVLVMAKHSALDHSAALAYDTTIRAIGSVPAADVVEVVHASWVPVPSSDMTTGKAYICGNPKCGKMRYGSFQPPFCAMCGARMDGDAHD